MPPNTPAWRNAFTCPDGAQESKRAAKPRAVIRLPGLVYLRTVGALNTLSKYSQRDDAH